MYKSRIELYTKTLLQRTTLQQTKRLARPTNTQAYYSSLRRVRTTGKFDSKCVFRGQVC